MENIRKSLPKGFLSKKGEPTIQSVNMYVVYLLNRPENWDEVRMGINPNGLKSVRKFFKTDFGFETMILWGIQFNCSKSSSSYGRHISMNKSYILAKSLIGSGVVINDVDINGSPTKENRFF
jgi:hypothetical protein